MRLRYFCSPQHTDSALYPIISQGTYGSNQIQPRAYSPLCVIFVPLRIPKIHKDAVVLRKGRLDGDRALWFGETDLCVGPIRIAARHTAAAALRGLETQTEDGA